jgi:hypothetical protein
MNSGLLLLPRTNSTGQVMAVACSSPKVHSGTPGTSVSKKVAASSTACAIRPVQPVRWWRASCGPLECQEAVHRILGVAGFVAFDEGRQCAREGRPGGRHEQHRFQERERCHPGRKLGRELQGDRSTQGVPDHVLRPVWANIS